MSYTSALVPIKCLVYTDDLLVLARHTVHGVPFYCLVYTDDMLALFRPAEQSSTAGNHPASFAVDGRSDTESSTRNEKATWFKLDLGGRYVVSKVKVHTMDHDVGKF